MLNFRFPIGSYSFLLRYDSPEEQHPRKLDRVRDFESFLRYNKLKCLGWFCQKRGIIVPTGMAPLKQEDDFYSKVNWRSTLVYLPFADPEDYNHVLAVKENYRKYLFTSYVGHRGQQLSVPSQEEGPQFNLIQSGKRYFDRPGLENLEVLTLDARVQHFQEVIEQTINSDKDVITILTQPGNKLLNPLDVSLVGSSNFQESFELPDVLPIHYEYRNNLLVSSIDFPHFMFHGRGGYLHILETKRNKDGYQFSNHSIKSNHCVFPIETRFNDSLHCVFPSSSGRVINYLKICRFLNKEYLVICGDNGRILFFNVKSLIAMDEFPKPDFQLCATHSVWSVDTLNERNLIAIGDNSKRISIFYYSTIHDENRFYRITTHKLRHNVPCLEFLKSGLETDDFERLGIKYPDIAAFLSATTITGEIILFEIKYSLTQEVMPEPKFQPDISESSGSPFLEFSPVVDINSQYNNSTSLDLNYLNIVDGISSRRPEFLKSIFVDSDSCDERAYLMEVENPESFKSSYDPGLWDRLDSWTSQKLERIKFSVPKVITRMTLNKMVWSLKTVGKNCFEEVRDLNELTGDPSISSEYLSTRIINNSQILANNHKTFRNSDENLGIATKIVHMEIIAQNIENTLNQWEKYYRKENGEVGFYYRVTPEHPRNHFFDVDPWDNEQLRKVPLNVLPGFDFRNLSLIINNPLKKLERGKSLEMSDATIRSFKLYDDYASFNDHFGDVRYPFDNDYILVATKTDIGLYQSSRLVCNASCRGIFNGPYEQNFSEVSLEFKGSNIIKFIELIPKLHCFVIGSGAGLFSVFKLTKFKGVHAMRQEFVGPEPFQCGSRGAISRSLIGMTVKEIEEKDGIVVYHLYLMYHNSKILTYEISNRKRQDSSGSSKSFYV